MPEESPALSQPLLWPPALDARPNRIVHLEHKANGCWRILQVAGEAVKELPSWAGPDVIIAATMTKLDTIVAAASAQAWPLLLALQMILPH